MKKGLKTHEVLDLHYTADECHGCFVGTREECEAFAATQTPEFMYKVVPMTKEEIEAYPDNEEILKSFKAVNYGEALAKMQFPENPMLLSQIQDELAGLKGEGLVVHTIREKAVKEIKNAIGKVLECEKDNPELAERLFGGELLRKIHRYMENLKPIPDEDGKDDIPSGLFQSPGIFGYAGDN